MQYLLFWTWTAQNEPSQFVECSTTITDKSTIFFLMVQSFLNTYRNGFFSIGMKKTRTLNFVLRNFRLKCVFTEYFKENTEKYYNFHKRQS